MSVHVINNPVIKYYLTKLQSKTTKTIEFRFILKKITYLMAPTVFKNIKLKTIKIETPLKETTGYDLNENISLCTILRASLGMVEPLTNIVPFDNIFHIGMQRLNHLGIEKDSYKIYYLSGISKKLHAKVIKGTIYIVDPMLATGISLCYTIKEFKKLGFKNIVFMGLLGSKQGIKYVQNKYPDIDIYLAAIHDNLTSNNFIDPGLGDAGDRLFGT